MVSDTDAGEIEAIWEQCFYLERGRLNVEGRVTKTTAVRDKLPIVIETIGILNCKTVGKIHSEIQQQI